MLISGIKILPLEFYEIIGLAGVVLLTVWNIFLQLGLRKLKKKNEEIFAGNKVKNLEGVILEQTKSLKTLDKDIQELYSISNQINSISMKGLHKIGLVRFNPFEDIGGDQSFSIALLNGKSNGLVISSLYTREGTRTYSKTVKGGKAEKYPLTQEEEKAIKIAISNDEKKVT